MVESSSEASPREPMGPMKVLTVAGVVVSLVAGAVGVLFTLRPELKPCLGETNAEFTGAPVFPRSDLRTFLARDDFTDAEIDDEVGKGEEPIGAEVRFIYRVSGFRGQKLRVAATLVRVEGQTLGAVVPEEDRNPAVVITPEDCSENGGDDLFVEHTQKGQRYRIVLELYRDEKLKDRIALTQTVIFEG